MPELDAARVWTEMQPQVTAAMQRFKRIALANGGEQIRLYSQALYLTPHRPTSSGDCYGLAVRWCLWKLGRGADVLTDTLAAASTASRRADQSTQFTSPVVSAVDDAQSHQHFRHDSEAELGEYLQRAPNDTAAARVWLDQGLRCQSTRRYAIATIGPMRAASFITSQPGAYMILLPRHAVAAVRQANGTWYFDPNFGEAFFPHSSGFRSFLVQALRTRQRHGQLSLEVNRYR